MSCFSSSDRCMEYFRHLLVADEFKACRALGKCAFRSDDTDLLTCLVLALSEKELLSLLVLELELRPNDDTFRSDGLDSMLVSEWARRNCKVRANP